MEQISRPWDHLLYGDGFPCFYKYRILFVNVVWKRTLHTGYSNFLAQKLMQASRKAQGKGKANTKVGGVHRKTIYKNAMIMHNMQNTYKLVQV